MQNSFPALHGSGLARDLGTVTKKKWYILIVVVLLAVGCYYLYEHWGDFTGASAEPSEPNAPARIVWTPIDRSGEGFRLQMPAGSHEIQVPAYNENGGTDQVSMLYAYPDSATSYSIAWEDNPPVARAMGEDPMETLNSARNGALTRTQATLVSEQSSNRQGYPVQDFSGRNAGGGVFNARLILAGRCLYMLMAAFPSASARRQADVDHFFNSFQILPTASNQ